MKLSLLPFSPIEVNLQVSVHVILQDHLLSLTYELQGDIGKIKALAKEWIRGKRQDELWKSTCFEWFLKAQNSPEYIECNLNSHGDWQFYHFKSYREGQSLDKSVQLIDSKIELQNNIWKMTSKFNLENISLAPHNWLMNICCVLETQNSSISYWSIQHPQDRANFHRPECFTFLLKK